jgi:uncharacterized NAD(P)/FAD-binding protein YdhS
MSATLRESAPSAVHVVAIIGAGFSGTATAIQLLRARPPGMQIVLLEPRAEAGAGVAYAPRDYPYPLNVAAGQMSLDAEQRDDFLDFVRGQDIDAAGGDYLPRPLYGEYLRERLAAARAAARDVAFEQRRATVIGLRRQGARFELWLDDGTAFVADDVVLATGNAPPACPEGLRPLEHSARYIRDPWSIGAPGTRELESVLLVGSGLTMIDAALRLAAIRPRVRHIYVLSRHGWLPQVQARSALPSVNPEIEAALAAAGGSTRRLTHTIRALAAQIMAAGGDWRELVGLLRPRISGLWHGLDTGERARFLRHARSAWDAHRHRVPASPLAAVQTLIRQGVLESHAGRIERAIEFGDDLEITWRPRGVAKSRAWLVDLVVNCTGPESRAAHCTNPLVQSLLANGLIRADAHGLGIDVTDDARVIGRDGAPVDSLYYVGPWLRARDWESTAVPELRVHAARLALRLAARAARRTARG